MGASLLAVAKSIYYHTRNTLKTGQSLCSAVILRKRSAFKLKFYLIVVSIYLMIMEKGGEHQTRTTCKVQRPKNKP